MNKMCIFLKLKVKLLVCIGGAYPPVLNIRKIKENISLLLAQLGNKCFKSVTALLEVLENAIACSRR